VLRPVHMAVAADDERAVLEFFGVLARCRPMDAEEPRDLVARVAEHGEGEFSIFLEAILGHFRRISADGDYFCPQLAELLDIVVQREKLTDAMVAVVAKVENQHDRAALEPIAQAP